MFEDGLYKDIFSYLWEFINLSWTVHYLDYRLQIIYYALCIVIYNEWFKPSQLRSLGRQLYLAQDSVTSNTFILPRPDNAWFLLRNLNQCINFNVSKYYFFHSCPGIKFMPLVCTRQVCTKNQYIFCNVLLTPSSEAQRGYTKS